MSQDITSVQFRMYNTGSVGDCHLLLFHGDKGCLFKMLIDCGGWNADKKSITDCANDILKVTEGELDLLVVTHQHEDHISGFNQAREVFDKISVKEVWMSWIEDKDDEIAKILQEKYGKKLAELKGTTSRAIEKINKLGRVKLKVHRYNEGMKLRARMMADTLQLINLEEGRVLSGLATAGKKTNEDAMKYLKVKGKNMKYRLPGQVIQDMPGADGVKFFILGPPRDADMRFFKIDMEEEEMYHLAAAAGDRDVAVSAQSHKLIRSGINLEPSVSPFDKVFELSGVAKKQFFSSYDSPNFRWRQIETDWLESAVALALRMTNLTNNTSLAMAIGFANNKVMLLPADAQSGNWMGWHKPEVMNELKKNGGKDTRELLNDTVFYKVGHHGSHNGTASKSGLELMNQRGLVAMMPLIKDKVPEGWGGPSKFPAKALYEALIEKTKGRIIRTDVGIIKDPLAVKSRNKLTAAERKQFTKAVQTNGLYAEYVLKIR